MDEKLASRLSRNLHSAIGSPSPDVDGFWGAVLSMLAVAQLIVRNIEQPLVEKLKLRAAKHGRSAEAEHREILRQALSTTKSSLKEDLLAMPDVGEDADFEVPRTKSRRRVSL